MSFSSPEQGQKPSLGQSLGQFVESRYPVAGGLAHAVFGGTDPSDHPAVNATGNIPNYSTEAPTVSQPQMQQPDMSMINMNAQPKKSSVGADLIKAFFA